VAFVPLLKSAHIQNHNTIPGPLLNDRLGNDAAAADAALGYQSRLHLPPSLQQTTKAKETSKVTTTQKDVFASFWPLMRIMLHSYLRRKT
jgi:hypothetical protein